MTLRFGLCVCALAAWTLVSGAAMAQTSVNYGKITAVKPVTVENPGAQGAGADVSGVCGGADRGW